MIIGQPYIFSREGFNWISNLLIIEQKGSLYNLDPSLSMKIFSHCAHYCHSSSGVQ